MKEELVAYHRMEEEIIAGHWLYIELYYIRGKWAHASNVATI